MPNEIKVLGFAGSLRKGSYNRALLRAAVGIAPENVRIEVFELEGIPLFNQDQEKTPPDIVHEFKKKIRAADAILMVTPEYNYSIPGVMKNAIDWGSRPYGDNAFQGKPVAMMSASIGQLGGARAQYHLRQSFVFLDMRPLNMPEVFVTYAPQKFDESGKLIDSKTVEFIQAQLAALVALTIQLGCAQPG